MLMCPLTNDLPHSCRLIESLYSEARLVAGRLNILCLESLEGGDVDVRDEGVELIGRVLVLVSKACQANADAVRDVSETIKRPELTTQLNVTEQRLQSHGIMCILLGKVSSKVSQEHARSMLSEPPAEVGQVEYSVQCI